ncbi:MBL fold metallo-hydrolase [Lutispora saccharofermentans]|uniref:MBL fold metallo-hydrolase n=1 Tax=Lutispora saccharofermentans TaxID=3024236 RepID=A0ABT1NGR0_9FIRM|nr:MBL fold metallo-hydrolase [Lutispora saccharofermentans]MCQ1530259.1 MBL fold metallo-hydrolase [Lutispora saccharofermentans]
MQAAARIRQVRLLRENALEVIKKEKWTEVGENIYVFTGEFYLVNMVLVTSGGDAVLIDTGMDDQESQNVMDFMNEKELKLKNIIITHMHEDHTANLEKFITGDIVPITPENAKKNQIVKIGNKNLRILRGITSLRGICNHSRTWRSG